MRIIKPSSDVVRKYCGLQFLFILINGSGRVHIMIGTDVQHVYSRNHWHFQAIITQHQKAAAATS